MTDLVLDPEPPACERARGGGADPGRVRHLDVRIAVAPTGSVPAVSDESLDVRGGRSTRCRPTTSTARDGRSRRSPGPGTVDSDGASATLRAAPSSQTSCGSASSRRSPAAARPRGSPSRAGLGVAVHQAPEGPRCPRSRRCARLVQHVVVDHPLRHPLERDPGSPCSPPACTTPTAAAGCRPSAQMPAAPALRGSAPTAARPGGLAPRPRAVDGPSARAGSPSS